MITTNVIGHMQELYEVFAGVLADILGDVAHNREDGRSSEDASRRAGDGTPAETPRDRGRRALERHVQHRGTVATVEALLQRAGFEPTRAIPRSFGMRFADGSSLLRHHFIRLGFVLSWKELVPEASLVEVFQRLEQRLDEIAAARGSLDLTIPMVYVEARKPGL